MDKHDFLLELLNYVLYTMENDGYKITLDGKINSVIIEISDIFILQREPFWNMTDAIFDRVQLQIHKSI